MDHKTTDIRKFLNKAFNDEELSALCLDYFPEVSDEFTVGMTKGQKIQILLAYCQRREIMPNLLAAIQEERPAQYAKHLPHISIQRGQREPIREVHKPRQVYISHAHVDADFAHQLAADLQRHGWQVWIAPDNILPGEKWVEAINRGLAESNVFVLVLTPAAVESRWVRSEASVAIQLEHQGRLRFIPLEVQACDIPPLWDVYQRISFLRSYKDAVMELLTEIRKPQNEEGTVTSFVGREHALRTFHTRFAYRHMKNAIYYCGRGGIGKTWLLRKIFTDNQGDPLRSVPEIIDFFETKNQSVRGLQSSMRQRLSAPEAFEAYDAALTKLEKMRADPQAEQTGALASQERQTDKLFIEACQRAAQGKDQVLLFDTFERVQERDVGRWFLDAFVPEVRNIIVVIAGRPEPAPAVMPGNVLVYPLKGFTFEETLAYAKARPDYDEQLFRPGLIQILWEASNKGIPLRLNLLLHRVSHRILSDPKRLTNLDEVDREIVKPYLHPPTKLKWVLWTMSFLKRRFDMPMLRYIVEHGEYLRLEPSDYETIRASLQTLEFIKKYPELQSHLLHDEIQRIFSLYLLPEIDERWGIRAQLYELVVDQYYGEQITKAHEESNREYERQLRAEQLGYLLDRDTHAGVECYLGYRREIESSCDYDLEELLWGEVQDHLEQLDDRGYKLCLERARWLRRHSRFPRAESQYLQMFERFGAERLAGLEIRLDLGHVLLRQGRIQDAITLFEEGRNLVEPRDLHTLAFIDNNLGQAKRAAGRWDEAVQHYSQALAHFASSGDKLGMARAYSNRAYIYSLKGEYNRAKQQCRRAIGVLQEPPDGDAGVVRLRAYALLNMGTACRHSGDYHSANYYYEDSLNTAKSANDLETTCQCLQNLGINSCLMGRRKRWEHRSVAEACKDQEKAIDFITRALAIARLARWRWAIGAGLSRLARVFEEIARFAKLSEARNSKAFRQLVGSANVIEVPEELEFEQHLLSPDPFNRANWLGKATRLFELSALIADEASDFHRALDSQMQLARLLLEQGLAAETKRVVWQMGQMTGVVYQEELFLAMADITMADLSYDDGDYDAALRKYKESYAKVAKQSGYATYLLTDRLRSLEERLRRLLPDQAAQLIEWCDHLAQAWTDASVSDVRPDMLDLLETIRLDAQG